MLATGGAANRQVDAVVGKQDERVLRRELVRINDEDSGVSRAHESRGWRGRGDRACNAALSDYSNSKRP
jgi:hypothetical protein